MNARELPSPDKLVYLFDNGWLVLGMIVSLLFATALVGVPVAVVHASGDEQSSDDPRAQVRKLRESGQYIVAKNVLLRHASAFANFPERAYDLGRDLERPNHHDDAVEIYLASLEYRPRTISEHEHLTRIGERLYACCESSQSPSICREWLDRFGNSSHSERRRQASRTVASGVEEDFDRWLRNDDLDAVKELFLDDPGVFDDTPARAIRVRDLSKRRAFSMVSLEKSYRRVVCGTARETGIRVDNCQNK